MRRLWLPRLRDVSGEDYVDPIMATYADSVAAVVVTILISILILVFLPYIFFVLELLVIPAVFVYRVAFHKPWTIEASSGSERRRWQVRGWRRARAAADEIASALRRGDDRVGARGYGTG